jgi:hypothetical protein
MTSLSLVQPVVPVGCDREAGRQGATPRVSAARAIVVALERIRVTGLPVEIHEADHAPLTGADLVEMAEAVRDRERAPVRIRWTDAFDGFVFEPDPT